MKALVTSAAVALALLLYGQPMASAQSLVEIVLVDTLDETRGYCLDIAGGRGKNAPLDQGLQAHTCYHYTGEIPEDQGFDPTLIRFGQFRLPHFEACMAVAAAKEGEAIALDRCTTESTQKFRLTASGQIVTQDNPNLCITVNASEKREGRGGTPIHVMRPLSLQTCDAAQQPYQTWSLYR